MTGGTINILHVLPVIPPLALSPRTSCCPSPPPPPHPRGRELTHILRVLPVELHVIEENDAVDGYPGEIRKVAQLNALVFLTMLCRGGRGRCVGCHERQQSIGVNICPSYPPPQPPLILVLCPLSASSSLPLPSSVPPKSSAPTWNASVPPKSSAPTWNASVWKNASLKVPPSTLLLSTRVSLSQLPLAEAIATTHPLA